VLPERIELSTSPLPINSYFLKSLYFSDYLSK
jgi:hypothetical protein